jgi:aspartate/methionine/tyrosine aminotransferase
MTNILLAKPKLPKGWTDFSVGEPHVVREVLTKIFNLDKDLFAFAVNKDTCEYPPPNGWKPLVDLLEKKHNAPVIITNGAKQALGAAFYACKQMGKSKLGMRNPYWALIPPLAKQHGLECAEKYDCYLSIMPNNPDGFIHDYEYAKYLDSYHRYLGIPFIHDAAYYTHVYLPDSYVLGPLGNIQIYSISKMYGLSGLRLGYVVCHDREFYQHIIQYMEMMTVGVSTFSQGFLHELLREEETHPELSRQFEVEARNELYRAKFLARTIHQDVLEVPKDFEQSNGMFGWFKLGPRCDFKKAKINVNDGALFGGPGMVRINLGLQTDVLKEAIARLNSL